MLEIALFEPDIAQNTGTILRLGACFGVRVNIIEPCGFIFGGKEMKRATMDYLHLVDYKLHNNWEHFLQYCNEKNKKIALCTTKTTNIYYNYNFAKNSCLLFGKESAGVPQFIHQNLGIDKITIPMNPLARSLNLAVSCGIVVAEGLRQLAK